MLHKIGGCGAKPDTWADGWDKAIDTAISRLEELPAADVQEVKHGEWNRLSLDDQDDGMYICSNCKSQEFIDDECDIYTYCPHCGAREGKKSIKKFQKTVRKICAENFPGKVKPDNQK